MSENELKVLISECIAGDITGERHRLLETELKVNPRARAMFREAIDLDAGLRTWSDESAQNSVTSRPSGRKRRASVGRWVLPIAVSVVVLIVGWVWQQQSGTSHQTGDQPQSVGAESIVYLGTILQQDDSVWASAASIGQGSRFPTGLLSLESGVAELKLDSGTNLVMNGPCEIDVIANDSARLVAGSVVVRVSELSDGFFLETPDATIIDEGTEYAVALDSEATEVHVFDGSVIWDPVEGPDSAAIERIEAGEARRYPRADPFRGARVPLGQRLFVRQIEAGVREHAGDDLLAYDGFENVAGRIRRGRSGFGWSTGWEAVGRRRGNAGTIVDAPDDLVFGHDRSGRRLLQLDDGQSIRRDLERPVLLAPGAGCYVSLLLERDPADTDSGTFFEASLVGGESGRRGRRPQQGVGFGLTSEGYPFVKAGGAVTETALRIEDRSTCHLVAKIVSYDDGRIQILLRVYQTGESVDVYEPDSWTTVSIAASYGIELDALRVTCGSNVTCHVDELKVGTSWSSVTAPDAVASAQSRN